MMEGTEAGGSVHPDFEDDPFASEDLAAAEDMMADVAIEPGLPADEKGAGSSDGGDAPGEGADDDAGTVDTPIYHPAQVEYGGSSFAGMVLVVDSPQKMSSGFGSYMAYPVSVKKEGDASDAGEALILRRYSDFLWLRDTVCKEYHGRLVPPMPPKHSLQGNKFEDEFLEVRRAALSRFVERLMAHPVLSRSKALDAFLTAKNHEWPNRKKDTERIIVPRKADAIVAGKALLKKKTEKMSELTAQVAQFEEQATKLQDAGNGLTVDTAALGNLSADLGAVARTLPEKDDALRPVLEEFARTMQKQAESVERMLPHLEPHVSATFREYKLFAESLKSTVGACHAANAEAAVVQDMLDAERRNKEEIEKPNSQNVSFQAVMGKPPAEVRAEKLQESELAIERLTNQTQAAENEASQTDANLDADLEHFARQEVGDFKSALGAYAACQREHSAAMQELWSGFIDEMKRLEDLEIANAAAPAAEAAAEAAE